MQRDALLRVDDHGPADEDGRIVMPDLFEGRAAFRKISPRRKTNQQPRVQRPMDGCLCPGGDLSQRRKKGAVKVDRDHSVTTKLGRRHRWSYAPRKIQSLNSDA